jgi:hypothetical protein
MTFRRQDEAERECRHITDQVAVRAALRVELEIGMNVRSRKRSGTPERMFGRPTCEYLEDVMTSPDQPGQPSQETREPSQDTLRQLAGRFSLRRGNSAWLGITLSLIALVAVSAALIAVAAGGGTHQATSSASGGLSTAAGAAPGGIKASQAPSGISKAKANVPSAAQVAESGGALSLPANMQSRVITWQFSPGGTRLAAVSSLFGTALQERGLRQYQQMKHTCTQLAHSVSTAQAGPPIPVAAMQILYGQALAELARGTAECQTAITAKPRGDESLEVHVDAALLRQSVSELAAGARDIFRSTAEIEIVSRQLPPGR